MARYCANCGGKVEGQPNYCPQCGKVYFSYEEMKDFMAWFMALVRYTREELQEEIGSAVPEEKFFRLYSLEVALMQANNPETAYRNLLQAVKGLVTTKTGGKIEFIQNLVILGFGELIKYRAQVFMGTILKNLIENEPQLVLELKAHNLRELEYEILDIIYVGVSQMPNEAGTRSLVNLLLNFTD